MKSSLQDKQGFSFFEVMVAIAVLSAGLILIYNAFFISVNYTNHLTYRLQADILLDEKIAGLKQLLQDQTVLPLTLTEEVERVKIHNKPVDFQYTFDLHSVENLPGLFLLDISVSWRENSRRIQLSRSIYISNYKLST